MCIRDSDNKKDPADEDKRSAAQIEADFKKAMSGEKKEAAATKKAPPVPV